MNNYWSVSNLRFIAKILETLVLSQFSSYLNSQNLQYISFCILSVFFLYLYNTCQSAYRPGHSTEAALLKVVYDLLLSLNKGNISVLALLDFSSAFDTIDHSILVHRLHTDFGFTYTVLQWFSSDLTDRTHYTFYTILFTMYIKPLFAIIDSHSIIHHSSAHPLLLNFPVFSSVEKTYLFCNFLCTVLDKHAPPSLWKVITHNSSPWFESI